MGIRNSGELVESHFHVDRAGNPTGGETVMLAPGAPTSDSEQVILIRWQDGIVGPDGQNGAFVEDVIEAARQRIQFFNSTKFRCRENSLAITKLEEALMWLDARTDARLKQGVENTYEVHDSDNNPPTATEAQGEAAKPQ